MKLQFIITTLLFTTFFAKAQEDTSSVYKRANEKLQTVNYNLLKYGDFKPRNLDEAFLVFLTGDSVLLDKFKGLEQTEAINFALQRENHIFRYDWGQEVFLHFSLQLIREHKLFAPELQNKYALLCFYGWMNEINFDQNKTARQVKKGNGKINRYWKKRFRYTQKQISRKYEKIWKEEKKASKQSKKTSHPYLQD